MEKRRREGDKQEEGGGGGIEGGTTRMLHIPRSHDLPWRRRRSVPPRRARSRCRASRTTPCRSDLSAHASWQRRPPRASRTTGYFMTRAIAMRCAQRLGSIAMRLSRRGGFRGSRNSRSAEECKSRGFGGRRGLAGEGEGEGVRAAAADRRSETEKQCDRRGLATGPSRRGGCAPTPAAAGEPARPPRTCDETVTS